MNPKVFLSAGSYQTHLIPLGKSLSEVYKSNFHFLNTAYPNELEKYLIDNFSSHLPSSIIRYRNRCENIPKEYRDDCRLSELIIKIAQIFRKSHPTGYQIIEDIAYRVYINKASKLIESFKPNIYHYRACFGGYSARHASKNNVYTICDQSIAHPNYLMDRNLFNSYHKYQTKQVLPPFLHRMKCDIESSNLILVNSEFVKKTCVNHGISENKIRVIYLGCDNKFLSYSRDFHSINNASEIPSLLYCGGWTKRKGVHVLAEALSSMNINIELIVGGASYDEVIRETPILLHSKVKVSAKGYVMRNELASLMRSNKIFVFPSLAEGSARVVFEALASGCYVITTEESGSIVKEGVNGSLVQANSVTSLKKAINYAFKLPSNSIDHIRKSNHSLIHKAYTQDAYLNKVDNLYSQIKRFNGIKT